MARPKLNRPKKPKLTLTPDKNTCDNLKEMCAAQHITVTEWLETRAAKDYKKWLKANKKQAVAPDQLTINDISKVD